jgi:hypothetical protein
VRAMRMPVVVPFLLLTVVLGWGCDGADGGRTTGGAVTPVSTMVPTVVAAPPTSATAAVVAPTVPATAPSELPGVAAVTRAVAAGDAAALTAVVRYTDVPCLSTAQGSPAPPLCAAVGAPVGTLVATLPALLCEGEYLPRAVVPSFLAQQLERGGLALQGVLDVRAAPYAFPADFPPRWSGPQPAHAVVFRSTSSGLDLGFYLAEGQVVALRSFGVCGPLLPPPRDPAWCIPPSP